MIDPVTFALCFIVAFAVSVYTRSRRRRARMREFDGGFRHDNEIRVTRIMSPYITTVRND